MHHVDIGRGAQVRRAIIDKHVRIPAGMKIGFDPELDRQRGFTLSDNGVVVIGKDEQLDPERGIIPSGS
jgi:glucose-1-phosphate adenylyltransferase